MFSKISVSKIDKDSLSERLSNIPWTIEGRVRQVVGTIIEAKLPNAQLGMLCQIEIKSKPDGVLSEIVGFRQDNALLLPYDDIGGINPGALVRGQKMHDKIFVGDFLLGNAIDPFLNPLGPARFSASALKGEYVSVEKGAPNPMMRSRIERPISLGIRAIDGLLTFGEGQRIGIMAGSGVGKSVLMGMIAKGSESDVNVIALIGERGREVREFIEKDLGPQGLARSVVVVVTSDQSPLMRLRAAKVATAISEYFSMQGKRVLLMMDSLTRVAQAQREVGLAVGEPPTTKGYPPSVYSLLPRLLERCGPQAKGRGSISGLYTVLVDGDDFNDPIPDAARSILDGHIYLSRALAAKGHFPAIEVHTSVSRVMNDITSEDHQYIARQLRGLVATYLENFDLIQLGSYQSGSNPMLDIAIKLMPGIDAFLRQDVNERANLQSALEGLSAIISSANS